ncbi:thiazolylpeptide-type bacteriocin [Kribbella italica]|uniref:Thiazolylpeptide-type bacteriocin n=1 Tax=Kribbella italica TaxID=1540520 RepID=A0A7W9JB03_9ACTN|nr:thiazolylpeptide-type bacteriocin [Kribbella italica]MBB5838849.1 thiazolylpeptide-type bacteriocin precursor [Kribbella italica]
MIDLTTELLGLETATFEVEEIADVGQDNAGWCSSSTSTSSCSSCSTSSCCGCSSCSCSSTS